MEDFQINSTLKVSCKIGECIECFDCGFPFKQTINCPKLEIPLELMPPPFRECKSASLDQHNLVLFLVFNFILGIIAFGVVWVKKKRIAITGYERIR